MNQEINTKRDLSIIRNYFIENNKPIKNGVVVECGAASGNYNPSLYLENQLNWKFIGFEPNPQFWDVLNKNRPSPNAIKINKALSNINGVFEFNVVGDNSSLIHSEEHKIELKILNRPISKTNIGAITWKNFVEEYNITHVDLFILDVEGCELMVLDGMKNCEVLPSIIMIEYPRSDHSFKLKDIKNREDFSGFKIIKDVLVEMGYVFDYVQDANAMFSKNNYWDKKNKPTNWFGEDDTYTLTGFVRYNKKKCLNLQ